MVEEQSKYMKNIQKELKNYFKIAIQAAFPEVPNAPILIGKSQFADFQCSSALPLVKQIPNNKLKPQEIASKIIANLPSNDLIESSTVSGPGHINISIKISMVKNSILNIVRNGVNVNLIEDGKDERIVIDYSSPNVAKEMHVGHLRSTIIGESASRLLEFAGYKLIKLNHIGDWGTQFGMLLAHLSDKYPDFKTKMPEISDLNAFYKESKKRFDEDEVFKKRAYETVVRLQSHDPESLQAWKQICDVSRQAYSKVYSILNVSKNLVERGESFYQSRMVDVIKDLTDREILIEEDGRKMFFPNKKGCCPLTVVKSDGGYTYATSDLAALRQRVTEEKATRIIYTTDVGQWSHFEALFDCGQICGYYDPKKTRLDHLGFGVVLGEDKKRFKTRSGETVKLMDLIQEGLDRAMQKLVEKGRDKELTPEQLKEAQEAIAIGCIKYADLSHDRKNDYVFSFDRMLEDRGNTAVYLLYSLTRIRSIIRKLPLEKSMKEIADNFVTNNNFNFEHEREVKLAKFILNFADIIAEVADDLYLHKLCAFLYQLCTVFSEFYEQCYVIQKRDGVEKVFEHRVILCEVTAMIMEKSLDILGIKTIEKM